MLFLFFFVSFVWYFLCMFFPVFQYFNKFFILLIFLHYGNIFDILTLIFSIFNFTFVRKLATSHHTAVATRGVAF